eukprot:TRINITY_DN11908_c0_g1_i1.p1 TRINITY_DN11908_c0_g1~~TRINITY_DN11908_c0_g1_i1.p1  ORF type:complete len:109 (-),score=11.14 TRINITY_DN11908_c0_g1_i1:40-366(-)
MEDSKEDYLKTAKYNRKWLLTSTEDQRVIYGLVRLRGYRYCTDVVKPYATCVTEHQLFSDRYCKHHFRRMTDCIHTFADKNWDDIREEFMSADSSRKTYYVQEVKNNR